MKLMLLSISLFALLLFIACGGNGGSSGSGGEEETDTDLSVSLQPRPIPKEYQGLTMEQLKSNSTEILYYDLNISTDYYKGKLVWFKGKVKEVFEIQEPGTYQVFIDTKHVTDVAGMKVDKWRDPVLLLYSVERGPELHENDMVQFTGTVLGAYTNQEQNLTQFDVSRVVSRPVLNAVKLEPVSELD